MRVLFFFLFSADTQGNTAQSGGSSSGRPAGPAPHFLMYATRQVSLKASSRRLSTPIHYVPYAIYCSAFHFSFFPFHFGPSYRFLSKTFSHLIYNVIIRFLSPYLCCHFFFVVYLSRPARTLHLALASAFHISPQACFALLSATGLLITLSKYKTCRIYESTDDWRTAGHFLHLHISVPKIIYTSLDTDCLLPIIASTICRTYMYTMHVYVYARSSLS